MNEFKKCSVKMLPTKDATRFARRNIDDGRRYLYVLFDDFEPYDETSYENHHLYIVSDNKVRVGDYFKILEKSNTPTNILGNIGIFKCIDIEFDEADTVVPYTYIFVGNDNYIHRIECIFADKIIATTDKSLNLPEIPEQFLKEFCFKGGIWEAQVEYEIEEDTTKEYNNGQPTISYLKVINNTINIKPIIEQNYTRRDDALNRDMCYLYMSCDKY